MFPTFISILDIQSWWEVPSVAHFCSLFRAAFNLLDFDIEDLEEALLTDGTEETSWLQELIVRLVSGCLANNEISTFNYQMFLRRLFRQKCQEHDRYNPFNTDIDFQFLPLRTKVEILQALCDFRLDADDVLDHLKNLEADSLRVEPLGYDDNESVYWYFYGTRLYREDFTYKNNKKVKCVWQVICFTEDDWYQLARKFRKATSKTEKQLYRTLSENFLPELPRLFQEKEVLHRKRLLEWLPRRTSTRLDIKRQQIKESFITAVESPQQQQQEELIEEDSIVPNDPVPEDQLKDEIKIRKKHKTNTADKAKKKKDESNDLVVLDLGENKKRKLDVKSDEVEMAERRKQRELRSLNRPKAAESNGGAGGGGGGGSNTKRKSGRTSKNNKTNALSGATSVGRQTNNSLASATGQIVIQSVSNPTRKKLKISQVFRQTEEDLETGMYKILESVKNHEDAWPFLEPVEEEYAPNYYTIIRRPMDLQRMEDKLDSGLYPSYSKFKQDFQLIVDNCRLYNGSENEYSEMVENLQQAFQRATDRYLDQISSSDEEIAVEFQKASKDNNQSTIPNNQTKRKQQQQQKEAIIVPKRKPTSLAHTADKRDRSVSLEPVETIEKSKTEKNTKITRSASKTKNTKNIKKIKKVTRSPSPKRSRSRSPSPSWPSLSPRHWKSSPSISNDDTTTKTKGKQKHWKEVFTDKKNKPGVETEVDKPKEPVNKYKEKNIKLKETIEKLKAKSELLLSDDGVLRKKTKDDNNKHDKIKTDVLKDNVDRKLSSGMKSKTKPIQKDTVMKTQTITATKKIRSEYEFDEEANSTKDSSISENKKSKLNISKKNTKKVTSVKNVADIDALSAATEQTLKDINKWLDDTPRYPEFSSASNSPLAQVDESETINNTSRSDQKKIKPDKPIHSKPKDTQKEVFKRRSKEQPKVQRRREIQRTIERLQPGKSKGNLLSNIQNSNKPEELFPLGPLSKLRDTKNSLVDKSKSKSDQSAPKLSLGTVLDSFGQQHNFNDADHTDTDPDQIDHTTIDPKKDESINATTSTLATSPEELNKSKENEMKMKENVVDKPVQKLTEKKLTKVENKATPNLSAWFKAFGAPKVPAGQKKKTENEDEKKENNTDSLPENKTTIQSEQKTSPEEIRKVVSPEPDSPAQPTPRQRRGSTGSSVSSSFSQDMDSSPRMSIDERLGAYPAPYPSPLHRSPASASPVMASPRQEDPQRPYPTLNGSIRVGFYQDTVSTKSSPDKSCSPRDQPHSPYQQQPYQEHVYTQPNSYAYPNPPPYYSQNAGSVYATTSNPSPVYGDRGNPPSYYDTTKSLTDQYNAKDNNCYRTGPEENLNNTENLNNESQTFRLRVPEKQPAVFPVKKRFFNDNELVASGGGRIEEQSDVLEQQQQQPESDYGGNRLEMGLMTGRQLNISATSTNVQEMRPDSRGVAMQMEMDMQLQSGMRPMNFPTNVYNIPNHENAYALNNTQYQTLNYSNRPPSRPASNVSNAEHLTMRYQMNYRNEPVQSNVDMLQVPQVARTDANNRAPAPGFNSPPAPLGMDQSLGLRSNLTNLSHIVDRYSTDDRLLTNPYYAGDKGLPATFSQANVVSMSYNRDMQQSNSNTYTRTLTELQTPAVLQQQQQLQQQPPPQPEKKPGRKRKVKQPAQTQQPQSEMQTNQQGFQSYVGLKNSTVPAEPSAIALKTASVVPGSAFNFGPAPSSLGLPAGLYGDNSGFLDEYRPATNYYMAAAAAAHRSTPETNTDVNKQGRNVHHQQGGTGSASGAFPFLGHHPQPRAPGYPSLASPFMNPHQAPPPPPPALMDPNSPLYQQYLHSAGVLHQGLLAPPTGYPPGYHPALSMRQPYDSMTRPSWL